MTADNKKTWDSIPSLSLEMDVDYEDRLRGQEGRRHDRTPFDTLKHLLHENHRSLPIRISSSAQGIFDGKIVDLSISGVRILMPKALNKGERVKVGFIINKRTILANAVTRWVRTENDDQHTAGLEFHGIAADVQEFIDSLRSASLLMNVGSIK
jgi:hypothetical protein